MKPDHLANARGIIRDWFTAQDGQSYAIGKVLAVPMFFGGLPLPWVVLFKTGELSLTEAGAFYGLLGAAVMALVWGTAPQEPKAPPAAG